MSDNYLIHGTNALRGGLRYVAADEFRYDPKSVQIYLSAACRTLTYLVDDGEALSQISNGINQNPNEIFQRFADFIEEFVKPDQALLVAAGMDEKMGQYLFQDLAKMQRMIEAGHDVQDPYSSPMNPDLLRERIKELQYSVCEEQTSITIGRSPLWRAIRVIGGGAIITTNYFADTVIGGLASAYSQAFGGYLVGKGLERIEG